MENIVTQSLGTHSLINLMPPAREVLYDIWLIDRRDKSEVCKSQCNDREKGIAQFPSYLATYHPELFAYVSQSGAENFGIFVSNQGGMKV